MGILSFERSLLIRQVVSIVMVLSVGGFAYMSVHGIVDQIELVAGGDAGTPPASAAPLLAATQDISWEILLATAAAVLVTLVVSIPAIRDAVVRPVAKLAEGAAKLADGDISVAIEGRSRRDDIGQIARALVKLRDDTQANSSAMAAARHRTDASSVDRAHEIVLKIEAFGRDLAQQVHRLGSMTRRLGEAAEGMIVAARHANDGSDQATTASSNAAGDVSSVATASEQLLDSIEEISRQVVQSTNVVRTAVEGAIETNSGMGRLSAAAQKVGDVVSLISRIAAQTNLLALNATIEAARAGEAGRGFAVVAQEVKTLATQTAKATQDITGQIAEMQHATDLSVDAIDKIQKKISEVEHISTIIAAAVHEQGAATQEIARNVRSAAAGTASMSSHIENVVRSVGETSSSANSVVGLARELDEIAKGMTEMVTVFSKAMKAA
jgi:methyl-accepting chemotaxis protein